MWVREVAESRPVVKTTFNHNFVEVAVVREGAVSRVRFGIKLCAPNRAQAKGRVERFHGSLREPPAVSLQSPTENLMPYWDWMAKIANIFSRAMGRRRK